MPRKGGRPGGGNAGGAGRGRGDSHPQSASGGRGRGRGSGRAGGGNRGGRGGRGHANFNNNPLSANGDRNRKVLNQAVHDGKLDRTSIEPFAAAIRDHDDVVELAFQLGLEGGCKVLKRLTLYALPQEYADFARSSIMPIIKRLSAEEFLTPALEPVLKRTILALAAAPNIGEILLQGAKSDPSTHVALAGFLSALAVASRERDSAPCAFSRDERLYQLAHIVAESIPRGSVLLGQINSSSPPSE